MLLLRLTHLSFFLILSTSCTQKKSESDTKIVGGTTVSPAKYPFFASMIFDGNKKSDYRNCGASFIKVGQELHALSAAHCTEELARDPSLLKNVKIAPGGNLKGSFIRI